MQKANIVLFDFPPLLSWHVIMMAERLGCRTYAAPPHSCCTDLYYQYQPDLAMFYISSLSAKHQQTAMFYLHYGLHLPILLISTRRHLVYPTLLLPFTALQFKNSLLYLLPDFSPRSTE